MKNSGNAAISVGCMCVSRNHEHLGGNCGREDVEAEAEAAAAAAADKVGAGSAAESDRVGKEEKPAGTVKPPEKDAAAAAENGSAAAAAFASDPPPLPL